MNLEDGQPLTPLPGQWELKRYADRRNEDGGSDYRAIIGYGGVGSGKTGACLNLLIEDVFNYPGNKGVFIVQRQKQIIELFDYWSNVCMLLRNAGLIEWSPARMNNSWGYLELGLKGNIPSRIYFYPLDGERKLEELLGFQIGFAFVDQMEATPPHTLDFLLTRLRRVRSLRRCLGTANPSADLYSDVRFRYGENPVVKVVEMQDRGHLPKDYEFGMEHIAPHLRRQYKEGRTDTQVSSYCLGNWERFKDKIEVEECPFGEPYEIYFFFDHSYGGWSWASLIYVKKLDDVKNAYHVQDEIYWFGASPEIIYRDTIARWKNYNIRRWYIDPATTIAFSHNGGNTAFLEMVKAGFAALQPYAWGNHTKTPAIHLWNDTLIPEGRFTINKKNCEYGIPFLKGVKWKDYELLRQLSNTPMRAAKKDDHFFDTIQGCIRTVDPEITHGLYKQAHELKAPPKSRLAELRENLARKNARQNELMDYLGGLA